MTKFVHYIFFYPENNEYKFWSNINNYFNKDTLNNINHIQNMTLTSVAPFGLNRTVNSFD
jgi:hypothetical protein